MLSLVHLLFFVASVVSNFAGNCNKGFKDGGGGEALFNYPRFIVFCQKDNVFFVTDEWNHRIRKITMKGINTLDHFPYAKV